MPRSKTTLLLLAAIALVAAGVGSALHAHDDAGQSCRLCQTFQGSELPDTEAAFLGKLVLDRARPVDAVPPAIKRLVTPSVLLRAPPALSPAA